MRIGLIACCKTKLDHSAPARDLYCSPLFRASRDWISVPGRVNAWAILSARHGLVMPDTVLDPYEQCLADMATEERAAWAASTRQQIVNTFGNDPIFLTILGEHYRAATRGLPFIEDVITGWTRRRRDDGMSERQACMSIGILIRELRSMRAFG